MFPASPNSWKGLKTKKTTLSCTYNLHVNYVAIKEVSFVLFLDKTPLKFTVNKCYAVVYFVQIHCCDEVFYDMVVC